RRASLCYSDRSRSPRPPDPLRTPRRSRHLARVDAPRQRRSFARLEKALELPNLIDIQKRSFEWLVATDKGGLRETIDDVSPIEDYTGNLAVVFEKISFDEPTASIEECREKDLTSPRTLSVTV